jgi:hypothetical protein
VNVDYGLWVEENISKEIMFSSTPPYLSYLLRLWLAGNNDPPEWRLALIDPQTGERIGFASLDALTDYLQAMMEEVTSSEAGAHSIALRFREGDEDGELTD